MKRIEFVRIKFHLNGFGLAKGVYSKIEDYQDTITKYINDGWSYEGFIPVEQRGNGEISKIDLIFTKD